MEGVNTPGFDRRLKYVEKVYTPDYLSKNIAFECVVTDSFTCRDDPGFQEGAASRRHELVRRAGTPARRTKKVDFECEEYGYHSFSQSAGWTLLGRLSRDLAVLTKGDQMRVNELKASDRRYRVFKLPEKRNLVDALYVDGHPLRLVIQILDLFGGGSRYEHCVLVPSGEVVLWQNEPISPAKQPEPVAQEPVPPVAEKGRSWFLPVVLTLSAIGGGIALAVHYGVLEIPDEWAVWRAPKPVIPEPIASPPVVPEPVVIVRPPPPLGFQLGRD